LSCSGELELRYQIGQPWGNRSYNPVTTTAVRQLPHPGRYHSGHLEECQVHLRCVLARLRWLRQSAFLQGTLERFARAQATRLQQENTELKGASPTAA